MLYYTIKCECEDIWGVKKRNNFIAIPQSIVVNNVYEIILSLNESAQEILLYHIPYIKEVNPLGDNQILYVLIITSYKDMGILF